VLSNNEAYTGYRRSIDGVLETGSGGATNKSNSNDPQSSEIDVENHTMTSTATIITQNTSSHDHTPPNNLQNSTISENFIKNEQQAQAPPQPAPRTRLSSQNSVPMTNGEGAKTDDNAQVRVFKYYVSFCLWDEKVKA
jgi:hypothetical protein